MESWDEQKLRVLDKIKPKDEERRRLSASVAKLISNVQKFLNENGIGSVVESHGSVAHDTWLSGESDIDLFIIIKQSEGRTGFYRVVETLKTYFKDNWVEAYAEHPYLQTQLDGYKIDLVPCFKVENGKITSATDRTPLHTKYLEKTLTTEMRDETRLLKQFLKRIGVYGAEIKVSGFSGYLTELLIVAYGSFLKTLESASSWKEQEIINLKTNNWEQKTSTKLIDPLTLVDPVDSGRNTASAVSNESKWIFTAAARKFLKNPNAAFFIPKLITVNQKKLVEMMNKGINYVFLIVKDTEPDVSDTLWGQLLKAEKAFVKALKERGFQITRSNVLSDEKSRHVFIFELELLQISNALKQYGPPIRFVEDSEKFVDAHVNSEKTLQGPGIENNRWWVVTKREFTDAKSCLKNLIRDGGTGIGVPKKISEKILDDSKILINNESIAELKVFYTDIAQFINGRPDWLD
jgi:tRNA nucleotidyltransferase (CCA-adding enzyme)